MTRRRVSTAARLAGVLGLVLPAALLLPVGPAGAAVSSPGRDTVFASDTTIAIRAEHGPSGAENQLVLTSPGGPPVVVARSDGDRFRGGTLSYALDTGCWTPSCSGSRPAPNGQWVLEQSGGATDRLAFVVRIAPRAPQDVAATAVSSREVRLSWTRGAEPDLTGFAVFEGERAVVEDVGTSACDGASCTAVVRYPADRTGERSYVVRAYRSTSPGSAERLASEPSPAASATLPEPAPSPEPGATPGPDGQPPAPGAPGEPLPGPSDDGATPAPGGDAPVEGGPGTAAPSSGGGAARPSAAPGPRRASSLSFNAFAPQLGAPRLPSAPGGPAPSVAEPLADGTFDPTLGFQDQVSQELVETSSGSGPTAAVANALDSERLARSTAGALVLLLIAAHLRRWSSAGGSGPA